MIFTIYRFDVRRLKEEREISAVIRVRNSVYGTESGEGDQGRRSSCSGRNRGTGRDSGTQIRMRQTVTTILPTWLFDSI